LTLEVVITFDVEADCPGIADSYIGVQKGLPKLLALLDEFKLNATFFVTGKTAKQFPELIRLLAEKHEIASHGFSHIISQSSPKQLIYELQKVRKHLQEVTGQAVIGYRAPRLRINTFLLESLKKIGFQYDSSLAWWLPKHRQLRPKAAGIIEFPLLLPNSLFRFPRGLQLFQIASLTRKTLIVLYFHPSESVPMRPLLQRAGLTAKEMLLRPDRWINTGSVFLKQFKKLVQFLHRRGATFETFRDFMQ
jgi:peptidoglycan/xylan/chitin deacetylase (PgdA/CDA1 family)